MDFIVQECGGTPTTADSAPAAKKKKQRRTKVIGAVKSKRTLELVSSDDYRTIIAGVLSLCNSKLKDRPRFVDLLIRGFDVIDWNYWQDRFMRYKASRVNMTFRTRVSPCVLCKAVNIAMNEAKVCQGVCNRCKYCDVCYEFVLSNIGDVTFSECFTRLIGREWHGRYSQCAWRK